MPKQKTAEDVTEYLVGVAARIGELKADPGIVIRPELFWYQENFAADITWNFLSASDSEGNAWKPLKFRSGTPLYLTGAMFGAALSSARSSTVAGGTVVSEMSEPKYWKFHQFGTKGIPARPFFNARRKTVLELADRVRDRAVKHVLGMN